MFWAQRPIWLAYLWAESPEGRMFGGLRLKLSAQRLDKRQLGGHAGQRAVVTASVQTVLVVPHPSTPTLGEVFFLGKFKRKLL